MDIPSIDIQHLSKSFGCLKAVDDVSLALYPSQIITLLGPNGAGKSTLINMLAGFLAPTSGTISIQGRDQNTYPLEAKQKIGFLPEGSPLYDDMPVRQFITYMAKLQGCDLNEVNRVIALANVDNVAEQKIEELSKGYKRRVGFAVSLLGNPPILILDEPTDGLDPNQKAHMLQLITKMSQDKTILISTHLLDEAQTIAQRILIMNHGKIKSDGTLENVLQQTKTSSLEEAFVKLTRS